MATKLWELKEKREALLKQQAPLERWRTEGAHGVIWGGSGKEEDTWKRLQEKIELIDKAIAEL